MHLYTTLSHALGSSDCNHAIAPLLLGISVKSKQVYVYTSMIDDIITYLLIGLCIDLRQQQQ